MKDACHSIRFQNELFCFYAKQLESQGYIKTTFTTPFFSNWNTNQSLSVLKIHLETNYVIGKINSLSLSYVIKLWVKDFVIIYFSMMKIIARAKKHYVRNHRLFQNIEMFYFLEVCILWFVWLLISIYLKALNFYQLLFLYNLFLEFKLR